MEVEHYLTIRAVCPVDRKPDVYECVVRCNRLIKVEDILAAVAEESREARFQEDLTAALARRLACEVETRGEHLAVQTRVVCGRG